MTDHGHIDGPLVDGPGTAASQRRLALFGSVVGVLLLALVLRLWFLQVVGAQDFQQQATANSIRTVVVPAARGVIVDRKGRPIARNRNGWDVVGIATDLNNERSLAMLGRLARALGEKPQRLQNMVRANANSKRRDPARPIVFKDDIDPKSDLFLALNERLDEFPGIRLQPSQKRFYPDGEYVSHLVGAVGPIPRERAAALKKAGYRADATVGVGGLEQYYEAYLRGQDGTRKVEVDVSGNATARGVISEVPAHAGATVQTSIDLDVQTMLARELREKVLLQGAQYSGGGGVVLDIQTGEVVALASFPFMDPNKISIGKAPNYNKNKREPARNRATWAYPPASTMKTVTAIAALEAGVLSPTELIRSPKKIKILDREYKNFRELDQGWIPLPVALAVSSDTYFYQVAYDRIYERSTPDEQRSGDNALYKWSTALGFGQPTNIDLMPGEFAGDVPNRLWRTQNLKKGSPGWNQWRAGDTVNMSVGQGDLKVTPLQMARAYAAILDPEHRLQTPTIAHKIVDSTTQQTIFEPARARKVPTELPPISPGTLEPILQGLVGATTSGDGTASSVFGRFGGLMAGKTGTAENAPRPDHAWFVGYGPATPGLQPKYVVAVVVENAGLGGSVAAPIACHTLAVALDVDYRKCGNGSGKSD
jgi:penicillin-binding protein 2